MVWCNYGKDQKLWHMLKITVFIVKVMLLFSCSPDDNVRAQRTCFCPRAAEAAFVKTPLSHGIWHDNCQN